jgi:hypothetical protein
MKTTLFWDVVQSSTVEIHRSLGRMNYFHLRDRRVSQTRNKQILNSFSVAGYLLGLLLDSENRGIMFLRNVSELLPEYTASYHSGQYSS